MSASAASSSSIKPSPVSSALKQHHQLPPVVHAIGKKFVNLCVLYMICHIISFLTFILFEGGSIGSALAILLLYPLERVRVELQSKANDDRDDVSISSETIAQCLTRLYQEQTLYKGASHMVTTLTISNAIFFYALQVTRRRLSSFNSNQRYQNHNRRYNQHSYILNLLYHVLPKSKMGRSLLSSSIAGCINVLLTNPLWVASLRIMESRIEVEGNDDDTIQQQGRPTLWNVMQRIVQSEGISSLWNGTSTSLLLVSNPIIQHFMYEQLRTIILGRRKLRHARQRSDGRKGNLSLSPLEAFLFGAVAKGIATVATYPLQLAQVLLRLQRKKLQSDQQGSNSKDIHDSTKYNGTLDCLGKQFSSRGISGLFQGMNAKLLQTVLTSAFTFLTYEQTLSQVGRLYEMLK